MPALYVVATPLGNLEDISLRALRTLREVKIIAAEDTRRTKKLLTNYDIKTPVTSYHEHNKWTKLNFLLDCLDTGDMALVSDAGMPGISDPGHELIAAAVQRNIKIVPIPGASIVVTAVAISGLPADGFRYIGFLPRKAGERKSLLKTLVDETLTIVILEAPHRLKVTLEDIMTVLGDRKIAVCRELTKIHEEVFRGTVNSALMHFTQPRGEFALVVEGNRSKEKPGLTKEIEGRLLNMQKAGIPAKEATTSMAKETGISRKELYQAWIRLYGGVD